MKKFFISLLISLPISVWGLEFKNGEQVKNESIQRIVTNSSLDLSDDDSFFKNKLLINYLMNKGEKEKRDIDFFFKRYSTIALYVEKCEEDDLQAIYSWRHFNLVSQLIDLELGVKLTNIKKEINIKDINCSNHFASNVDKQAVIRDLIFEINDLVKDKYDQNLISFFYNQVTKKMNLALLKGYSEDGERHRGRPAVELKFYNDLFTELKDQLENIIKIYVVDNIDECLNTSQFCKLNDQKIEKISYKNQDIITIIKENADNTYLVEFDNQKGIIKKNSLNENKNYNFVSAFNELQKQKEQELLALQIEKQKEQEKKDKEQEELDRTLKEKQNKEKTLKAELKKLTKDNLKTIQQNLKTLNFYDGPIDGIFGNNTYVSYVSWLNNEKFDLSYSVDDLNILNEQANLIEIAIQEEAKQNKKIKELERQEKERIKFAQEYIEDLLNFQKIYPTEFDIIELSKLFLSNKDIQDGLWDENISKNFDELESYVQKSQNFILYRNERIENERKKEIAYISNLNLQLEKHQIFLKNYLIENLTSDLAPQIINFNEEIESVLISQIPQELINLDNTILNYYKANDLFNLFQEFNKNDQEISVTTASTSSIAQVEKINEIDFVEFDFIRDSSEDDYISLVNRSGNAPHALLNLEGEIVFDNNLAVSCIYQSRKIDRKIKYYIYDRLSNQNYLIKDDNEICDRNSLLKYDLIIFKKSEILKEEKSFVSSLVTEISSSNYQLYKTISESEFQKELAQRQFKSELYQEEVLNETRLGYGALIIDNQSSVLCSDLNNNLESHKSIIAKLDNEFRRMAFDKFISEVTFDSLEETFKKVQRSNCGFIYSNQTSLASYINGLSNTNTNFEVLPIWYTENEIISEQQRIDEIKERELQDIQKSKLELEKEKELEAKRLEAEGITKANLQKELQAKSMNVVNYFIDGIEKDSELLFDKDTIDQTWLTKAFPDLKQYAIDRINEGWELNEIESLIFDYGLADFRSRRIETFIFDINIKIMNRDLGEYQDDCFRLGIISDAEFERYRVPELQNCMPDSMDEYKKSINFQSEWLIN